MDKDQIANFATHNDPFAGLARATDRCGM